MPISGQTMRFVGVGDVASARPTLMRVVFSHPDAATPAIPSASFAERALLIGPSLDSLICTPVSESFFTSTPRIVPLAICCDVMRVAAYVVPPSARMSASVAVTFAYVSRGARTRMASLRSPWSGRAECSARPGALMDSERNPYEPAPGGRLRGGGEAVPEAGYIAAMGAGSTGDDRWWRDFDGFVLGLLDGPSRILDVGSGDGSLGQRLREAGHEVVGVDPNALDELAIRARIEEVEPAALGRFDLVCASMALHHIDLRGALDAIAVVLVPDGLFVVNEFDWPAYDARAAAWVDEPESGDPVEHFATEHEDLHSRSAMLEAIGARFALREEQPRPYLARMLRRPEREPDERAAIAAGRVPALGFWLVAAQPSAPPDGGAGPV